MIEHHRRIHSHTSGSDGLKAGETLPQPTVREPVLNEGYRHGNGSGDEAMLEGLRARTLMLKDRALRMFDDEIAALSMARQTQR